MDDQFLEKIRCMVSQKLKKEVVIKRQGKNEILLEAFMLGRPEKKENFYFSFHSFYEKYKKGATIERLAEELIEKQQKKCLKEREVPFAFEMVRDKIYFRLVSYEKNLGLLEKMPYWKFLDFAVLYYCLIHSESEGICSIKVTKKCLKSWNITEKELDRWARENTPRLFPPVIQSMEEVIGNLIKKGRSKESYGYQKREENIQNKGTMYMLSNTIGINGAAALLYNGIISDFAEQVEMDLFILPSSIHEVILLPDTGTINRDSLLEMVSKVNQTQVLPEDILSEKVYYYTRKTGKLSF